MSDRFPMSPAEFDAACREFVREVKAAGYIVDESSGWRSAEGNREAGGNRISKHLRGMAHDYTLIPPEGSGGDFSVPKTIAFELGLWREVYEWGIHIQGLPVGSAPIWWLDKYGEGD